MATNQTVRSGPTMIRISSQRFDDLWFAIARNVNNHLAACAFSDESQAKAEAAVTECFPAEDLSREDSRKDDNFEQIYRLYLGDGSVRPGLLDFSHVSDFRKRVYLLLSQIPRGKVTTYGALAKKLGMPRAARAVGTAVATNPFSLIVPCHRVLTSNLEILNYGLPGRKSSEGAYMKRRLLEHEGVEFQGKRVSASSLWVPR